MPTEQAQIPPTHTETITYHGREFAATKAAFDRIDQAEALMQARIDDDPANDYDVRVDEATEALRDSIRQLSEQKELIYIGRVDHMATTFNGHITSPSEQRKLDAENSMEVYAEEVNRADEAQRVAEGMNNGEPVEWSEGWEADAERQAESGYDVDQAVIAERNPTEIVSMGSSGPLMDRLNEPEAAASVAVTQAPDLSWAKGFSAADQATFAADPELATQMRRSVESYDAAMNTPPGLWHRASEFASRVGSYVSLAVSATEVRRPIREEWEQFKAHVKAMAQPLQPSWVPAHADPRRVFAANQRQSMLSPDQSQRMTETFAVAKRRGFEHYATTRTMQTVIEHARRDPQEFQRVIRLAVKQGEAVRVPSAEASQIEARKYRRAAVETPQAQAQTPPAMARSATAQMYTLNGPNGSHMSADRTARDVFYALSRADWVSPETRARLVNEAVQAGAMRQGATHSVMPDVPERFRVQKQQKEQVLRNQQSMTH